MTATVLQFRPRAPKLEAEEMLRRGAEFREYVRQFGSGEPLLDLMADHHARFNDWHPDFSSTGPGSAA